MSALPTRIEKEAGRPLTPLQIFDITAARETTLSRLLMLYISTGLLFMLLPGTFLGVWNLLAISSRHAADSVSAAWIQAHGHAQIFGWIGTFILGIGFYSIPKLRRLNSFCFVGGVVVMGAADYAASSIHSVVGWGQKPCGRFNHTTKSACSAQSRIPKKMFGSVQWGILRIRKSGICSLELSRSQFALPHGVLSVPSPHVFANSFIFQRPKRPF